MELAELKSKTIAELLKIAEELDIPGVSGLRKSELIYKVMETASSDDGIIFAEGVLEIMDEGYGFLRSPDYNYLPGQDDIYVSPSQIKRFDLRTGDTISGQVRPPKDNERYFALLKIEAVNYEDPEIAKHKTLFDNLTPLYPDEAYHQETNTEAGLVRAADLIGQLADPNYLRKLTNLYYEFVETGMAEKLGYASAADLADSYPKFYWGTVRPYISDAVDYLQLTQEGKQWIANLHSHVFAIEHGQFRFGPHGGSSAET